MANTQPDPGAYEVRCHGCNVSFPVGTKRCLHCGEKIGRPRFLPVTGEDGIPVFEGVEGIEDVDEVEIEPTGGRRLRIGFTLVWLVLAIFSAAVRSCQGE